MEIKNKLSKELKKGEIEEEIGLNLVYPRKILDSMEGSLPEKLEKLLLYHLRKDPNYTKEWEPFFPINITLACGCKEVIKKGEMRECKCKHGKYFVKLEITGDDLK